MRRAEQTRERTYQGNDGSMNELLCLMIHHCYPSLITARQYSGTLRNLHPRLARINDNLWATVSTDRSCFLGIIKFLQWQFWGCRIWTTWTISVGIVQTYKAFHHVTQSLGLFDPGYGTEIILPQNLNFP